MCKTNYEIIKTRNLILTEGQVSDEVVLADSTGDMHFTFCLKYVPNEGNTHVDITDAYHATITIETRPNAVTKLQSPYHLGTYENKKNLFFNFVVQQQNADATHNVIITFYTN